MLVADRPHSVLKSTVIVGVEQLHRPVDIQVGVYQRPNNGARIRMSEPDFLLAEPKAAAPTAGSTSISYFSFRGLRKP